MIAINTKNKKKNKKIIEVTSGTEITCQDDERVEYRLKNDFRDKNDK